MSKGGGNDGSESEGEDERREFTNFMRNKGLVFEALPAPHRKLLKDDIIATAVQNLNELSRVPKEWNIGLKK